MWGSQHGLRERHPSEQVMETPPHLPSVSQHTQTWRERTTATQSDSQRWDRMEMLITASSKNTYPKSVGN